MPRRNDVCNYKCKLAHYHDIFGDVHTTVNVVFRLQCKITLTLYFCVFLPI